MELRITTIIIGGKSTIFMQPLSILLQYRQIYCNTLLVFCNIMDKIRKRTDTTVAFTQEYSRISYPLRNMSMLSTGSGSSKDTHAGVEKTGERTFYI